MVLERISYHRYISQFRAVQRGQRFKDSRSTAPRKLLPDSWGFLCPVNTPDGIMCGLLLHLTESSSVIPAPKTSYQNVIINLSKILEKLGMLSTYSEITNLAFPTFLPVMLDGRILGYISPSLAKRAVNQIRMIKTKNFMREENDTDDESMDLNDDLDEVEKGIPSDSEIAYFPLEKGIPFPGIYIFTESCRPVRRVLNLENNLIELIGSTEQLNLDIKCPDGSSGGSEGLQFTHCELRASDVLSLLASFIPYPEHNQSPRNMYQCQMMKQTMGIPCHDLEYRSDSVLYQ